MRQNYGYAVLLLSFLFTGIGIGLIVRTAQLGGGIGYLIGVLFIGLGIGRLFLQHRR